MGIVTQRDIDFLQAGHLDLELSQVMTTDLVTASAEVSLNSANRLTCHPVKEMAYFDLGSTDFCFV